MKLPITVTVNGAQHTSEVEPRLLLVHYLRDVLELTGTHIGCETGICGACTVHLNGEAVKSCMVLAAQADGCVIQTVESLAQDGRLDPVQQAFRENHGLQCGFCTPGLLMAAHELLRRAPQPTEAQIRSAISGNLCRCTGYQSIVAAVESAGVKLRGKGPGPSQAAPQAMTRQRRAAARGKTRGKK